MPTESVGDEIRTSFLSPSLPRTGERATRLVGNAVPDEIGALLGLPVNQVTIVHERGDLEFNGSDAVILN